MKNTGSRSLKTLLSRWSAAVANTSHPQPPVYEGPDVTLTSLVEHTDYVKSGSCFVARVRTGTDGHVYIGQAVAKGASLILGQRDPEKLNLNLEGVPYLQVADTALAEAWLAAAWFEFPSRNLAMIGITGTDGKTTTANLLFHILRDAGHKVGMLSTIKAAFGDEEESLALHVTTPEAPVVQAYLRKMVEAGLTTCILETTSHGLAQERVGAIDFDLAIVTNITHEHLDYHGDFESYFAAKAKLFSSLADRPDQVGQASRAKRQLQKTAVLNRDDNSCESLAAMTKARVLTYGIDRPAGVMATDIEVTAKATVFMLTLPVLVPGAELDEEAARSAKSSLSVRVVSSLSGRFNVSNMLAAAAAGHVLGLPARAIAAGLASFRGISGRMETVDRGQGFRVVVDFAHTPNALEKAIAAARSMVSGRIIAVFGSAGKRDSAKRRLMAEIAARDADLVVLTAEDPRTESLKAILEMMAQGCQKQGGFEGQSFWRIRDRGQAIHFAVQLAQADDLVLLCGKGHESSMCFGTVEYPWDEVQATKSALDATLSGRPMTNLGLPTFEEDFGF